MVGQDKVVFKTIRDSVVCSKAGWLSAGQKTDLTVLEPGEIVSIPSKLVRSDGRLEIIVEDKHLCCDPKQFWNSVW